jgi:hypothetical protein
MLHALRPPEVACILCTHVSSSRGVSGPTEKKAPFGEIKMGISRGGNMNSPLLWLFQARVAFDTPHPA